MITKKVIHCIGAVSFGLLLSACGSDNDGGGGVVGSGAADSRNILNSVESFEALLNSGGLYDFSLWDEGKDIRGDYFYLGLDLSDNTVLVDESYSWSHSALQWIMDDERDNSVYLELGRSGWQEEEVSSTVEFDSNGNLSQNWNGTVVVGIVAVEDLEGQLIADHLDGGSSLIGDNVFSAGAQLVSLDYYFPETTYVIDSYTDCYSSAGSGTSICVTEYDRPVYYEQGVSGAITFSDVESVLSYYSDGGSNKIYLGDGSAQFTSSGEIIFYERNSDEVNEVRGSVEEITVEGEVLHLLNIPGEYDDHALIRTKFFAVVDGEVLEGDRYNKEVLNVKNDGHDYDYSDFNGIAAEDIFVIFPR